MTYDELAEVKAISLTLRYHEGRLIIEVYDSDPTPPVLTEAGPDSESGHGLVLVRALSKEWSYYLPPSGGKTVYCRSPYDKRESIGGDEAVAAVASSAWSVAGKAGRPGRDQPYHGGRAGTTVPSALPRLTNPLWSSGRRLYIYMSRRSFPTCCQLRRRPSRT